MALEGRAEHRQLPGQVQHGAIDQLHGRRRQLDDEARHLHRVLEASEMADPAHLVLGEAVQLELDPGEEAERPFRADHQLGEVLPGLAQRLEVVAAHLAQELRDPQRNLLGVVRVERAHGPCDLRQPRRRAAQVGRDLAEGDARAVGQHRLHLEDVVDHDPVLDRPRARRVVARHSTDGGVGRGRDVHRVVPAGALQLAIQLVEHDAGLHRRGPRGGVDLQHLVHVATGVHHQRLAQGLSVLRASAAARDDREAFFAGDGDGGFDILDAFRKGHSDGLDLVDGRVRRVAATVEGVEEDVAAQRLPQARGESGIADPVVGHGGPGGEDTPAEVASDLR